MSRTFDGWVDKRSRFGVWQRRYMRTERFRLQYFSEHLTQVSGPSPRGKRPALTGKQHSEYLFSTNGLDPSESIDIRVSKVERVGANGHALTDDEIADELRYDEFGGTALSPKSYTHGMFAVRSQWLKNSWTFRADSAKEADDWVASLMLIKSEHERTGTEIGMLSVTVESVHWVADSDGDSNYLLSVEYEGQKFQSQPVVALDTGETYSHAENSRTSPVCKLNDSCCVFSLVDDVPNDDLGRKHTGERELSFGVFQAQGGFRMAIERVSNRSSPVLCAERTMSLFEIQERDAEDMLDMLSLRRDSNDPSLAWWPNRGPADQRAAPGCCWIALFAPGFASDETMEPRVLAFVEARVHYQESLRAIILADHERREVDTPPTSFDHEKIQAYVERIFAVVDEISKLADFATAVIEWRCHIGIPLAVWSYLLFLCWMIDSQHLLALPAAIMLSGAALALWPRISGGYQSFMAGRLHATSGDPSAQEGRVYRPVAFVRIACVKARNLIDADADIALHSTDVSDPFVEVVYDSRMKGSHRTTFGTSKVIMNSLDPVWDPPQPLSDMAYSDPRAKLLGDDTESFVDALCRSKLQTDRPWVVSRDNQVFWKAWCYPVLQEVETQLSGSPRVVPWSRIHGVVRIRLQDYDYTSGGANYDYLGHADLPLCELVNGEFEGWLTLILPDNSNADRKFTFLDHKMKQHLFDLQPSLKDASSVEIQEYIEEYKPFGEVYVKAALELPNDALDETDVTLADLEQQRKLKALLEGTPTEQTGSARGLTQKYKNMTRSLVNTQAQLHDIASIAERGVNLLTWAHPRKTGVVFGGFAFATALLLVIPNRLAIALGVSYLFADGFFKTFVAKKPRRQHHLDKSDIQLLNFLRSIPNNVELKEAFALRRRLFMHHQAYAHNYLKTAHRSIHWALRAETRQHYISIWQLVVKWVSRHWFFSPSYDSWRRSDENSSLNEASSDDGVISTEKMTEEEMALASGFDEIDPNQEAIPEVSHLAAALLDVPHARTPVSLMSPPHKPCTTLAEPVTEPAGRRVHPRLTRRVSVHDP